MMRNFFKIELSPVLILLFKSGLGANIISEQGLLKYNFAPCKESFIGLLANCHLFAPRVAKAAIFCYYFNRLVP